MNNPKELPEIPEVSSLTELAENLGLAETTEMRELKSAIIESIQNGENYINDYREYEDNAIQIVEQHKGEFYSKAQIALMIMKACIFRTAGNHERFKEDIQDAMISAHYMGFDDIVKTIKELLTH